MNPTTVVHRYYAAMRIGAGGEDDMMALFAEDAVYAEPFSGLDPAEGREAIRARLRSGWEVPLPDLDVDVLSITLAGDRAECRWECRSSVFDGPRRGTDRYRFVDDLIVELTVSLDTESDRPDEP